MLQQMETATKRREGKTKTEKKNSERDLKKFRELFEETRSSFTTISIKWPEMKTDKEKEGKSFKTSLNLKLLW